MGTRQGNKLAPHYAADTISVDSLSFAGLACIQDQQPKPSVSNHDKHNYQVSKTDPEFEFATIKADLNSGANPIKITPADVLISNGQIKPQALAAFQPNGSPNFITNPTSSLSTLLGIDHHINSKMSSGHTGSARRYHGKARNHANKERTATRAWFGQKVFRSFLSPCRKCKAIQPGDVKGQTVRGEKFKLLT